MPFFAPCLGPVLGARSGSMCGRRSCHIYFFANLNGLQIVLMPQPDMGAIVSAFDKRTTLRTLDVVFDNGMDSKKSSVCGWFLNIRSGSNCSPLADIFSTRIRVCGADNKSAMYKTAAFFYAACAELICWLRRFPV